MFSYKFRYVTRELYKMWGNETGDYLCSVLINDGLADFRDIHWHICNPEVPHYAAVIVAGCQMPHGTGKLQPWMHQVSCWCGVWSEPGLHRIVPLAALCSWWMFLDLLLSALSSMCTTGRAALFWVSKYWPSIFCFYRAAVPFCSNNNWQKEGMFLPFL